MCFYILISTAHLLLSKICRLIADNHILECIKCSLVNLAREGLLLLCWCSLTLSPVYNFGCHNVRGIKKLLESIHRSIMKMKDLEMKPHEAWLVSLDLFSLEETEWRSHCNLPLEGRKKGRH